jgi:uncharacterized protein YndB with AHSA1/START domain
MSAKYERTFTVAVSRERAWQAFVDEREREAWMGTPPDGMLERAEVKVGDVEPQHRLTWSQSQADLEGSYETVVIFEDEASGTRITIVRSGFGDSEDWLHYAENTARGWDEMIADLVLYLETGVRGGRHFAFRGGLGATALHAPAGMRITHVVPGGFAEQAGMRAGDLLLRLNGASVVDASDVAVVTREHAPGVEIEAEYVRSGEVLRGRGALSPWSYGSGVYIGHPGGYPKPALIGA